MPSRPDEPDRLDQIETRWSLLRLAHQGSASVAQPARNSLAVIYRRAIRAFVGALVQNPQDADELAQEFLVCLLDGRFHGADPERGRFRDLLKVSVANFVYQFYRRKNRLYAASHLIDEFPDSNQQAADEAWLAGWRSTLLDNTWVALQQQQERSRNGTLAWTVLRLRADHPDEDMTGLAERLTATLGRPVRADAMRQQLHRARVRFAELLLEEVARSLLPATAQQVEEELIALGLMGYVRDLLPANWRQTGELTEG